MEEITYERIIEYLINNGKYEKQFLIINSNITFKGKLNIQRKPDIEKQININIDKKIKYIEKTYYSGKITKKNPCIESITGNKIVFRSSRLFPTLYIDLLVMSKRFDYVEITFKKLFIGYHIVGLNEFYHEKKSLSYHFCLSRWLHRFSFSRKMLISTQKYKEFWEKTNG